METNLKRGRMVSEYDTYNFKELQVQGEQSKKEKNGKPNKGRSLWEKMAIALLIIWAIFTLIFGLMYFNDGFKSMINQSVICSDIPSCPTCPTPTCEKQTCECNYPEVNLTCNYPPTLIEVNTTQ